MRPEFARLLRHRGASLAVALVAVAGSAGAAGSDPLLPPPGQYRIDTETKFIGPNGGVTMTGRLDAASGDSALRIKTQGADTGERLSKGAPQLHCVHASRAPLPPLPANCKHQSTRREKDIAIHHAVCAGGSTKMTVRRLDRDRWEYLSEQAITSSIAAPNLAYLKPALEHEIKHGTTLEARSKAAQQLAQLPAMQAQMSGQHASTLEMLKAREKIEKDPQGKMALAGAIAGMQGAKPMAATTRTIWTRIAESCPAGQPAK